MRIIDRVAKFFDTHPTCLTDQLLEAFPDLTCEQIHNVLSRLRRAGCIVYVGPRGWGYWKVRHDRD